MMRRSFKSSRLECLASLVPHPGVSVIGASSIKFRQRRNRLAAVRMNKLVYVMFNKRLKDRHLKLKNRQSNGDEEFDPLIVDDMASDDEWLFENEDQNEDGSGDESGEVNETNGTNASSSKRKKQSDGGRTTKKARGNYTLIN